MAFKRRTVNDVLILRQYSAVGVHLPLVSTLGVGDMTDVIEEVMPNSELQCVVSPEPVTDRQAHLDDRDIPPVGEDEIGQMGSLDRDQHIKTVVNSDLFFSWRRPHPQKLHL